VHLVNTFLLLSGVVLAAVWATDDQALGFPRRIVMPIGLAGGALLLVGMTGAIAALGDTLFPAASLQAGLTADLDPRSHFLLQLRSLHPVFAILGGTYILALAVKSRAGQSRRPATALIALVLTQVGVGFVNLGLLAPVWLQLLHLLLADLVWITLVVFAVTRLRIQNKSAVPGLPGTADV